MRDRKTVNATMERAIPDIVRCVHLARWRNSDAQGPVEARIVIAESGNVESVCMQQPALRDGATLECVRDTLLQLNFGPGQRARVFLPVPMPPPKAQRRETSNAP
jgi:hypothetical protein